MNKFTNNEIFYFIIERFTGAIIAFQQWFAIPPLIAFLCYLFPLSNSTNVNKHKNLLLQLSHILTFIFIPLIVLLIFDDKCLQNWKQFWPYCVCPNVNDNDNTNANAYDGNDNLNFDYDYNNEFGECDSQSNDHEYDNLNNDCIYYEDLIETALGRTPIAGWICFDLCEQNFTSFRCVRQIFQVLGPLFTIKASIALLFPLLFPLLFHLKRKFSIKRQLKSLCCCCCKMNRGATRINGISNSNIQIQ